MDSISATEKGNAARSQGLNTALVLFALAILYDISPIELIPDLLPGIGWVDDFFVTATTTLNLIEKSLGNISTTLAVLVRFVKWGVVFLGAIAAVLVGFGIFGIVKLVTG